MWYYGEDDIRKGSFDAITQEKFLMIVGITCGVQVNWNKILFNILKEMVTAETRQARVFAIQISLLLENIPNLELGESTEFPSSKILTEKTVHSYIILNERVGGEDVTDAPRVKRTPVKRDVSKKRPAAVDTVENIPNLELGESTEFPSSKILTEKTVHSYIILNERVGGEDVTDAPRVKRTPVKRAVSKKRPAAVDTEAAPIVKKKRTTKRKAVSSKDTLDTLPVKSVPLQMIAPNTAALTEQLPSATIETIVDSVAEPVSETAVADVVNEGPSTTDDVDDIIQQVLTETAQIGADKEEIDGGGETVSGSAIGSQAVDKVDEFEQWLNFSYEEFHARQANRPVETASDTEDEIDSDMGNQEFPVVGGTDDVLGTNVGVKKEPSPDEHLVKESMEEIEDKLISTDEEMSLEDILMSFPVDVPLPSTGVEITKISLGKSIKIPGVDERTWYMASLPQIPVDDKGKKPLLEKDPVMGNPVKEQFLLIVADIDLLVQLREQIIDEVAKFFYSFSLKRLANLKIDDSYYAKEELVLSWAEVESTEVALQRRIYILLKYRELLIRKFLEATKINFAPGDGSSTTDLKILDWLSDLHLFVLEELKEHSLVHGLHWDKMCCSKIFEGRNRDRGAVIARSNTNTKSSCWIRTMLRVDGTWVIEPCADYWKPIPREVTSSRVVIPSRLSYVDTLPPMSEFFKLLKKRWGDVCIEVSKFSSSVKLLPVGSVNFFRSLEIFEPVSSFVSRQPTVFSLRLSQFCTVFVQYSLFSGLSVDDISSFVSTIAIDRTVLWDVQILQNLVSVAPSVQLIDERPSSASTSEDSSMHFDETDTVELLGHKDDVNKIRETISLHIHDLERKLTERFDAHDRTYRVLFNNVRHDMRDHKNLLSLDLKTYQQKVSNQVGAASFDVVDVRRVVKELDAKVAAVATGMDDVRKDVEATKEAISHQILDFRA
ncbi:hypothetical protein F511_44203 [Dorcoceras hygrometricum]|uniref:Splicing factor 3B subunit 1-like n=1 Tax=Dorcoceras hygrometricum TaxID=472368 RepID=A0A2Z6ZZC5_9LAMI|nr:hypothetical protein F511_44203 [Dorcoceras hygrometricum]